MNQTYTCTHCGHIFRTRAEWYDHVFRPENMCPDAKVYWQDYQDWPDRHGHRIDRQADRAALQESEMRMGGIGL